MFSASFFDHEIVWYENDGNQRFTEHTIVSNFVGTQAVATADVDGDGDIDVLGAVSVATADIDADGDPDVVSASFNDNTIAWYENEGSRFNSLDGNSTLTEGGSSVVLDADVQIIDPELSALNGGGGNFGGATLTLERSGGANSDDVFSPAVPLSFAATDFFLSGVKKGTCIGSPTGRLELTFNAGVTNAEVNQIMQSLQYNNSSDSPPASVDIVWTFNDNNSGSQGEGGALQATGSKTISIELVNDAPVTTSVVLTAIAEDSGVRLITQAELLVNTIDAEGDSLTANGLVITSGNGTLTDNADGTWSYSPAADVDTEVSFSYSITDGTDSVSGTATLDITPFNDALTTTPVTLAPIAEDSGARLITQAELLSNANDIEGEGLTAVGLIVSAGNGTLTDNSDGTWSYTPTADDDVDVSFDYTITDGADTVAGSATLDIRPVNDAPTTTPVTLTPIAEDSGARLITQVELLANASDIEGNSLFAVGLTVSAGNGTLTDNSDGIWSYTPAADDDADVSFDYTITDGTDTVAGTATLDITPVNDAPTTTSVTLAPIAEDSGARLIRITDSRILNQNMKRSM